MSDIVASKGEGGEPFEDWQAEVNAKLEGIFERRKSTPVEELAGPPNYWDLYAVGPYQLPALQPSRVIGVGEKAIICVVVYLNPFYPSPYPGQNACDILTGFNAKIELNFWTSNMQTMQPVPDLSYLCCIDTKPGKCWYKCCWCFEPRTPACLYETNICARICNCDYWPVRQYAGFVRWVEDMDYDMFFGSTGYTFDHPVRYGVFDFKGRCSCRPPLPD